MRVCIYVSQHYQVQLLILWCYNRCTFCYLSIISADRYPSWSTVLRFYGLNRRLNTSDYEVKNTLTTLFSKASVQSSIYLMWNVLQWLITSLKENASTAKGTGVPTLNQYGHDVNWNWIDLPTQQSQANPSTPTRWQMTLDPNPSVYLGRPCIRRTLSVQNNKVYPMNSGKKMHTIPSIDTTHTHD